MGKLGTIIMTAIGTVVTLGVVGTYGENCEKKGYDKGYDEATNKSRDEILKDLVDSKENQE